MMNIPNYIRETKEELKHVNWPTKNQAINYTIMVIVFSIGVALFLGVFDKIFEVVLKAFILKI